MLDRVRWYVSVGENLQISDGSYLEHHMEAQAVSCSIEVVIVPHFVEFLSFLRFRHVFERVAGAGKVVTAHRDFLNC